MIQPGLLPAIRNIAHACMLLPVYYTYVTIPAVCSGTEPTPLLSFEADYDSGSEDEVEIPENILCWSQGDTVQYSLPEATGIVGQE